MLTPAMRASLRCPACGGRLRDEDAGAALRCEAEACSARYPVEGGVPVLLDASRSLFSVESTLRAMRAPPPAPPDAARRVVRALTPPISRNVKGAANYAHLARLLAEQTPRPRVLVVGGGVQGEGMGALLDAPSVEILQTDVVPGPRTGLVCDAHQLPFADESFDAIVAQAVLEHVLDPARCAAEMHRVLRPRGLVYAETPFMQQVHEGRHDFTRFTHLGHRRLFRAFEEIDSGAVGGPGMALAWAWRYFLWSLSRSPRVGSLLTTFASLTSFWLPWCDGALVDRPRALDGAAGVYFLGRRAEHLLDDRDLVAGYRGAG